MAYGTHITANTPIAQAAAQSPLAKTRDGDLAAHAVCAFIEQKAAGSVARAVRSMAAFSKSGIGRGIESGILYSTIGVAWDGAGVMGAPSTDWFAIAEGDTDPVLGKLTGADTNLQKQRELPTGDAFDVYNVGFSIRSIVEPGDPTDSALAEQLLWDNIWWSFDRAREQYPEGLISAYPAPGVQRQGVMVAAAAALSGMRPYDIGWNAMREYSIPRPIGDKAFSMGAENDAVGNINAALTDTVYAVTIWLCGHELRETVLFPHLPGDGRR